VSELDAIDIRGECRWCGETYAQHQEKRGPHEPDPRMACLGLRRNFLARETAREPAVQVCGCDEAHTWKARALAAERKLAKAMALLRSVRDDLAKLEAQEST